MFKKRVSEDAVPVGIAQTLEEMTRRFKKRDAIVFEGDSFSYQELNENANRVAGGLAALGIDKGDRVALMLPNIPEFAFSFFGIQKLGAVAVPFNTMYKGREISFILNDSAAKAIICLGSFANLINEIKEDCPELDHVIVTGQRTLVFVDPDATANVQMVFERSRFESAEEVFRRVGDMFMELFHDLGVTDAWYKHQGAIRAHGKKLSTILLAEVENLFVVNAVIFLRNLDTDPLFKVVWVPAEIKDKVVEPMTSVAEESTMSPSLDQFRDALKRMLQEKLGISVEDGTLTRDELMAYEKNRALAGRM